MATSYTSLLGFALPATGESQGTWGDTVNNSITQLCEDSIAGVATQSVLSGDWTLSTTGAGVTNQARMAILIPTGSPGVSRNIIAPAKSKTYTVINQSNAAVVIKGPATTGVTVAAGDTLGVAWNGSDFVAVKNAAGVFTSITDSALTSGRVTYAGTGGLLQDSANLTFNGTTLTATGFTGPHNGTVGATTPSTGAFTTLTATTNISGPFNGTVGATTPSTGAFTTATASVSFTGPHNGTVGATTPSTGAFTTLSASSNVTLSGGTANGVLYLNGSKVVTTGSVLTFTGSNLGVGVNPAVDKLDVAGGITSRGLSGSGEGGQFNLYDNIQTSMASSIDVDGSNNLRIINTRTASTLFYTANTQRMSIDSTGSLILVGSTAQKASGTTWSNPSDIRLKDNITSYSKGIGELMKIQVKTWEYNGKGGTIRGYKGLGVIADEVMQILPDTVDTYKAKLNQDDAKVSDIKKFDATEITWLLVKTCQEQQDLIEQLSARITTLETK